jgi:hypothetical protein
VDSLASLVKWKPRLTELVFVEGFDVPFGDPASQRVLKRFYDSDALVGLPITVVRTSLRQVTDRWFRQAGIEPWDLYHGAAIAAVGLALAPRTVVIASSYSYDHLHPCGSHPLLDPLWSTENTEFVHDGMELRRIERLQLIGQDRSLLDLVRVCWEQTEQYNCGRCEKCLRTMVGLEGLGLLKHCRAFPDNRVDPRHLRGISMSATSPIFWNELEGLPLRPEIRREVERLLRDANLQMPAGRGVTASAKRLLYSARRSIELFRAALD